MLTACYDSSGSGTMMMVSEIAGCLMFSTILNSCLIGFSVQSEYLHYNHLRDCIFYKPFYG